MKTIKKVISGGQTGADQGGLRAAWEFGIPTGGWAPKDYNTEDGPNLHLKKKYGLVETKSHSYVDRTKLNVKHSDYTIVFMPKKSAGSQLTWKVAEEMKKSRALITVFTNILSPIESARGIIKTSKIIGRPITVNVAGNRESKSPGIRKKVKEYMLKLFSEVEERE